MKSNVAKGLLTVVTIVTLSILSIVMMIGSIFLGSYAYERIYLSCYRDINIVQIAQSENNGYLKYWSPQWRAYDKSATKAIENIENALNVDLSGVDLEKNMIIVSYGAELLSIDYNLMESSYDERGKYIGFPTFGEAEPNAVYFYKADAVSIFGQDEAGIPPEYNGKYRDPKPLQSWG